MAVSLTDIRRNRQEQASFTGREAELEGFRHNFELSFENEERKFIFAISGQGGIGKTSLLRRFREIAKNNDALIALTDESFNDLPTVLQRFAEDLEKQGFPLKNFTERYRLYRQKQQDLDNDPDLLRLRLTGRALEHKKGSIITNPLKSAKDVAANLLPFPYNVPLALLNEENLIEHASEWTAQVARKLGNKDEVGLLQKPLEFLTPLFLSDLQSIAGKRQVAFFFDTFEQTGSYLEPWLLRLFEGYYGDLPANVVLVLAGRDALDPQRWRENEGLMVRIPLAPFTPTEAEAFLQSKQVTNPQVVEQILNLSSRLPLLVSMLADQKPTDPQQIGDPCSTAVDRFLRWEDPLLQQLAMDAARPRRLNHDLIALLTKEEEQARTLFTWLKGRPFVQERVGGWGYHDVVREQMLRHKQREAPQGWAKLHQQLAEYYEKLRDDLGLKEEKGWKDETWQSYALEALYHRLCQAPQKYLAFALNGYLTALGEGERSFPQAWFQVPFAQAWAETIKEAGQDTGARAKEVKKWGERLVEDLDPKVGLDWKMWNERPVALFTALLENPTIEAKGRVVALGRRGKAYHDMGKHEEALVDFNRALELKPDDAWAIDSRGKAYWLMGKYEEALADLTHSIGLDPKYVWAIQQRGVTYLLMGQNEEAIADFNRVIELNPEDTWAIEERAKAYQEMGKYEEALADFTRAIELRPYATSPIIDRARAYQEMWKYEEALADFTRAIELEPNKTGPITNRAEAYQEMGKYDEAIADLTRVIELKPDDTWAIIDRAKAYQEMGKHEEAIADFTHAIELKPDETSLIIDRAEAYQKMGKHEEALADFTRAIELKPDETSPIANRARAYQMMGKHEEAIVDFTSAIALKHDDTTFLLILRAAAYQEMGKYEEALADCTRALELYPDDTWAITNRARAYQKMGKYEEALADLNRAIELDPENDWAITGRGETYRQMGKHEESLADFTRAIELKPENDWSYYLRALTFQSLGQTEKVAEDLAKAIELGQKGYESNPTDWRNGFNLAIYHLAAGDFVAATKLYHEGLAGGASQGNLHEAIQDLDQFLGVFPNHAEGLALKAELEGALK